MTQQKDDINEVDSLASWVSSVGQDDVEWHLVVSGQEKLKTPDGHLWCVPVDGTLYWDNFGGYEKAPYFRGDQEYPHLFSLVLDHFWSARHNDDFNENIPPMLFNTVDLSSVLPGESFCTGCKRFVDLAAESRWLHDGGSKPDSVRAPEEDYWALHMTTPIVIFRQTLKEANEYKVLYEGYYGVPVVVWPISPDGRFLHEG